MPKLSVIVPVYRAESFLNKCIDSILSQSVSDLELILVEDGSPDRSGEICDAWAAKDSRIQVIHQKNAGVSVARNRGLDIARGEWIGFVDSDDWVHQDMYSGMLSQAPGSQVVMCDFMTVYEDGRQEPDSIRQLPESRILRHEDFTPRLLLEFAQSACRCIYRRELIEEYTIRFPEGLKFSEDRVFNFYAMGYAEKICYVKEPWYMRFVNLESCVNTFHPDYAQHGKRAAEETAKALAAAWEDDPEYQKAFLTQYAGTFINSLTQLRQKHCPLSFYRRMQAIREICANQDFRKILESKEKRDRQEQMVLKKRYLSLYLYEGKLDRKLANIQEEYEQTGFTGVLRKTCRKLLRRG